MTNSVFFDSLRKIIFLVTGNVHKFNEARLVLSEFGLSTVMLNVETIEIQADSTEKVAEASVVDAAKKCQLPVIVEDAGLFVDDLNGFPGPYSSYVFRTIDTEGILRLMRNRKNRGARFESTVAFMSPKMKTTKCFNGEIKGKIAEQICGVAGFGFDPIFMPDGGGSRTFAEMTMTEKNGFSHRSVALRKFGEWYVCEFGV